MREEPRSLGPVLAGACPRGWIADYWVGLSLFEAQTAQRCQPRVGVGHLLSRRDARTVLVMDVGRGVSRLSLRDRTNRLSRLLVDSM